MRAHVWSILLYRCECWTLTKDTEQQLEAVEMWFIRRIMKVSWTKRKTNAKVVDMAGYNRSLLNTIRERQLKILGHIIRAGGLEKLMECQNMCKQEQRKTTHKIHSQFKQICNK
ncbi:endonuclease-reverse transcriptase [Plakobranchus ocellatus]|uniref:Endonuclease-reverse transcriptase n=1 Tax=Plakobranchus ocellatus TaxID=259542 RepID=A0AAV4B2W0_9GAST|nr:endonuclease-reverse transcriptase [Plakobranchus ocellatus]